MTDKARPTPFYPRTMLSWLVGSVAVLTLAVLGLSVTVLLLGRGVTDLATERSKDRAAAQQQSDAEIAEIGRLRQLVLHLGGNPGPDKFPLSKPPARTVTPVPVPESVTPPSHRPSPQPSPTPRPSSSAPSSSRPTPTATPTRTSPRPVTSCLPHPVRCLMVTRTAFVSSGLLRSRPDPFRGFLRQREPTNPLIDGFRVVVVVFGASYCGWCVGRWRRRGATCQEGRAIHGALIFLWLIIWLTEAEQIGLPWLPWRLPIAVVAIPATLWVEWTHRRTHHPDTPSATQRVMTGFRPTLR